MDGSVGANHSRVSLERAPLREIELLAVDIGYAAACLGNNKGTRRVVLCADPVSTDLAQRTEPHPDLLLVALDGGETKVDGGVTARDGSVLALAVHADRLLGDAQLAGDDGRVVVVGVAGLHGLAKVGLRGRRNTGDVDAGLGSVRLLDAALEGALSADGGKDATARAIGLGRVHGKVGAAHHADAHNAVNNERKADRKLLAAEESLGAVDRVERPEAASLASAERAAIDVAEQLKSDQPC